MVRPAVQIFTVGGRAITFRRDTLGYYSHRSGHKITLRQGVKGWVFKEDGELVAWGTAMDIAVRVGIEELDRREAVAKRLEARRIVR